MLYLWCVSTAMNGGKKVFLVDEIASEDAYSRKEADIEEKQKDSFIWIGESLE